MYKTWRSQRDKGHKIRLQATVKPLKGENPRNPLLIESDQSEISKTQDQDQDCHKSQVIPPPSLLNKSKSTKVNVGQISKNFGQIAEKYSPAIKAKFQSYNSSEKYQRNGTCEQIWVENSDFSVLWLSLIFFFFLHRVQCVGWVSEWGWTTLYLYMSRRLNSSLFRPTCAGRVNLVSGWHFDSFDTR